MSKAMIESGYSPKTAKNPQQLTRSRGWMELMERCFPDQDIAKTHQQLLHHSIPTVLKLPLGTPEEGIREMFEKLPGFKIIGIHDSSKNTLVDYIAPDPGTRSRALEMAYKLKGRFIEKIQMEKTDYDDMTAEDLLARRKQIERELKRYNDSGNH